DGPKRHREQHVESAPVPNGISTCPAFPSLRQMVSKFTIHRMAGTLTMTLLNGRLPGFYTCLMPTAAATRMQLQRRTLCLIRCEGVEPRPPHNARAQI